MDEFVRIITRFGDECRASLFGTGVGTGTGPDGDLDAVPRLLSRARSIGLLADASVGAHEGDLGVWGSTSLAIGPAMSLTTLALLAETCAGFASAVHAQGIGRFALGDHHVREDLPESVDDASPTVAALFVPEVGTALDNRTLGRAITVSDGPATVWTDREPARSAECDDDPYEGRLVGNSRFVWSSAEPDVLVVPARRGPEALVVSVDADAVGLGITRVTDRTGLRAVHQLQIGFDAVPFRTGDVIATGSGAEALIRAVCALDWLGTAAIALGTARAALREAKDYAINRIQGGRAIIGHAAVRMLLAEATQHVATLSAILHAVPERPVTTDDDDELLRCAVSARLGVADHAFSAVTNCLQVLGGYGYMDDYGISKRLRDVGALRSRHGNREQLLLALADLTGPATLLGSAPRRPGVAL